MNGTVPPSSVRERTAIAELTGMFAWIDWNQVSKVILVSGDLCTRRQSVREGERQPLVYPQIKRCLIRPGGTMDISRWWSAAEPPESFKTMLRPGRDAGPGCAANPILVR